jgi:hypothetical protein
VCVTWLIDTKNLKLFLFYDQALLLWSKFIGTVFLETIPSLYGLIPRCAHHDATGPVRYGPVVGPPDLGESLQVQVRPASFS